jgi:hypothetical protein
LYAELENIEGNGGLWVEAGATVTLMLNSPTTPITVTWGPTSQNVTVHYKPVGGETYKILTERGNTATATSSGGGEGQIGEGLTGVIGDFIPDYHSFKWAVADQTQGKIVTEWTSGWKIDYDFQYYNISGRFSRFPVWRLDVTYYGEEPITIDEETKIQIMSVLLDDNDTAQYFQCYVMNYTESTHAINQYEAISLNHGEKTILYFCNYQRGALVKPEAIPDGQTYMLDLLIYEPPFPNGAYAQSFPLMTIRVNA